MQFFLNMLTYEHHLTPQPQRPCFEGDFFMTDGSNSTLRFGSLLLVMIFLNASVLSCAGVQPPKPKVLLPASLYPNSLTEYGVSLAVIPFDPQRDIYANPHDPNPPKPDFPWFKAGVCPTRIIINNHSDQAVAIEPSQITCTDAAGVTYVPFGAKEAGDAVLASESFARYVRGALAGALTGAAIAAGLGAATSAIAGGGGYAARGAAIGAATGGTYGLLMGVAGSKAELEAKVRNMIGANQLQPQVLSKGACHEGVVYFPAVRLTAVNILLSWPEYKDTARIEVPVVMPPQETGSPKTAAGTTKTAD
jgi:hypothetical protein